MITARLNAFLITACGVSLLIGIAFLAASATEPRARAEEPRDEPTQFACDRTAGDVPLPFRLVNFLQPEKKDPAVTTRNYLGFKSCVQCHNSGIKGTLKIGGVEVDIQQEQWVLYKELPIWGEQDKHVQAYAVLLNDRSKKMGEILGVKELYRDRRCLACHTGFPLSQMPAEKDGLVDKALAKKFDISFGVSCEGCHGPAADKNIGDMAALSGWFTPHQTPPAEPYDKTDPWRFQTPQKKFDKTGFYDVRTPTSKTKLCVSCHIGDVNQGRVVTHEMYAAGHPPLPAFEIETFVKYMPKHWVEFWDKSEQTQDLFIKYTHDPLYKDGYKKKSLHRTRSLLAGALVVSSEYLRLMGQLSAEDAYIPVAKPDWPELSAFDCYACHHDLKTPSWRQHRKPPTGVPGRPPLQEWQFALTKIALTSLGTPSGEVDEKLAAVRKAISAQPFGVAKDLSTPAQTASAWFFEKGKELERKMVSREEAIALLKEIAKSAALETHDYDSARQLVWAFQIIQGDLKNGFPEAAKIQALIDPLGEKMLHLDLRAGRPAKTKLPDDPTERPTVEVNLEKVLPFIARYEPAQFQAQFKEVVKLLK